MSSSSNNFQIESRKPFSESIIWELNRKFYLEKGIKAWSDGIVPHNMTSNARAGKTYAELIFASLKDQASENNGSDVVYILELGAGHGRLAFHILKHLLKLIDSTDSRTANYCYVLSDIVEDNLSFFHTHPQFQTYFQKGILDISYFDASESCKLYLRNSKITISPNELKLPLIAIANYFFDSIPNVLFHINENVISNCSVSIGSKIDPNQMNTVELINNMKLVYHNSIQNKAYFNKSILNDILEEYRNSLSNTFLFFPEQAM